MFDTIVVAVDHSEQSDRAVAAAANLAKLSGGMVLLLHVKEKDLIAGKGGGVYDTDDAGDAELLLSADGQRLREAGLSVTTEIRTIVSGHVADQIVASAEEHSADIIVVGSHGRSGIARAILGGTSYKVLHLANRPVLVVR